MPKGEQSHGDLKFVPETGRLLASVPVCRVCRLDFGAVQLWPIYLCFPLAKLGGYTGAFYA